MEKTIVTSNIVSEEKYKQVTMETLDLIADSLKNSLGYFGSTTVMETNILSRNNITKDGYTILKKLRFGNGLSQTVLDAVTEISSELVKSVGDGSTSSVLASTYLYKKLENALVDSNSGLSEIPRKELSTRLKDITESVISDLEKMSTPINNDNYSKVADIAGVSNNNDSETGNIIYDLFKEIGSDGHVSIEESFGYSNKDYYQLASGMTTAYGYVDPAFANKENGIEAEFKLPRVLMYHDKLGKDDIDDVLVHLTGSIISNKNAPVVIVAAGFTPEFVNSVRISLDQNRRKGINAEIALTPYNVSNEDFKDLAAYLGATIFDKEGDITGYHSAMEQFMTEPELFLMQYVGESDSVLMDSSSTTFVGGKGRKEAIDARIEVIENQIENYQRQIQNAHTVIEIENRRSRIANLKGKVATLFVAGQTDRERKSRRYLIEDSVSAVRSALKYGYVPGGNLAPLHVITNHLEDNTLDDTNRAILTLLQGSIAQVYVSVLENANYFDKEATNDTKVNKVVEFASNKTIFNLKTSEVEKFEETNIINSVETDIRILRAIVSIVSLLAMSNQYIANDIVGSFDPNRFVDNSL